MQRGKVIDREPMEPDQHAQSGRRRQETQTLADRAFELIEEMIVTRQLAPGVMLSESKLAADLSLLD